MALTRPLLMQASGADATFQYSALSHRALVAALLSEGVVGDGDLRVSQRAAGANFTVDVAAGSAVIVGDSVAGQGSYLVVNDAPITGVAIPAAPASGSRTHRVVLKVRDKAHDGSVAAGVYDAVIEVLSDTGTGTPALPASAITLALVTVSSTTTTSILDSNISTGAAVRLRAGVPVLARQRQFYGRRGTGAAFDNYGSGAGFVTLFTLVVPAAPAGDYLITSQAVISTTVGNLGDVRLAINGANTDTQFDLPTTTRTLAPLAAQGYLHTGGDLTVVLAHAAQGTGTNTIWSAGTAITAAYLGAR